MKKTHANLKTIFIALLSLALVFSVAFATVASADTAKQQSKIVEVYGDDFSVTVAIDAQRIGNIGRNDVKTAGSEIVSQLKNILLNQLLETTEPTPANVRNIRKLGLPEIPDYVDQSVLGRYKEMLENRLREEGELEKYLNGDYDIAIKAAVAEYMDKHPDVTNEQIESVVEEVNDVVTDVIVDKRVEEIKNLPENEGKTEEQLKTEIEDRLAAGDNLQKVLGEKFGGMLEQNSTKSEEMTETVKDIVENGAPALEISDIIAALRNLTVGGHAIYTEDGGWSVGGVKGLVADLLAKFRAVDTEFVFSYDVVLEVSFGEVHFNVKLELVNYDGSEVQQAVNFVKSHIDFGKVDGVWTLNVNIPESVVNFYNYLPQEAQRTLFEISDVNVGEILNKVKELGMTEILGYLKEADYQGYAQYILDKDVTGTDFVLNTTLKLARKVAAKNTVAEVEEVLRNYGISGIPQKLEGAVQIVLDELHELGVKDWTVDQFRTFLTTELNAEMQKVLNRLENSGKFTDLYDRMLNYAERGLKYIPEVFQNETLTNVIADGKLNWNGQLSIIGSDYDRPLTKLVRKFAGFFGIDDDSKLESIVLWIDNNVKYENVDTSINASIPNLHKVSFTADGETVVGLLFEGADVEFFANRTVGKDGKNIVAWVNDEDVVYTEITEDVDLHAVTEFDVAITQVNDDVLDSDAFETDYDSNQIRIYASHADAINGEGHSGFTYQWYKNDEAIEGATQDVLTLDGNTTDSGTYKVVVTSANYTELSAEAQITVTIQPRNINFDPIWQYGEGYDAELGGYVFDGKKHSVSIANIDDLSDRVGEGMWIISGNEATGIGEYTAKLTLKDGNCNLITNSAEFRWRIVKKNEEEPPIDNPGEPGHKFEITDSNGNPLVIDGTTITVTDVNGVVPTSTKLVGSKKDGYTIAYFDFLLNGKEGFDVFQVLDIHFDGWDGDGKFTVTLTNDKFDGLTAEEIVLAHKHGSAMFKVETATISGKTITFEISNFSEFAILSKTGEESVDTWWIWLLLALIIVLNIVIILLLLRRKNDDEPTDGGDQEEQTKETETTEQVEEDSATTAEEPDEPEEPFVLPIVSGERTTLDRSFTARLSQAEDNVKEFYSEIKNELLSYKKVRSRVSWKFDSFYKGRNKCVILQLRGSGKKLNMYIALRAEDLAPKYHAKDVSDKALYASVPSLVKISGSRSLKYAKQLIAQLMADLGVERNTDQHVNYKIRRRSTKSLIRDGYIKLKTAKGRFVSPAEAEQAESTAETPTEEVASTTAQTTEQTPEQTPEQTQEQTQEQTPETEQTAETEQVETETTETETTETETTETEQVETETTETEQADDEQVEPDQTTDDGENK